MNFTPWKQSLAVALTVAAGTTAATAQNIQSAQRSIELGRYSEARASLRPGSTPEAAYELGRLYQFRDLPDSAAYYFNKATSATPMGQVAAGRALLAKGQTAAAEAQFDAAAKATKNKDAKILTLIAQAYGESDVKDITKALTYAEAAHVANKSKDEPMLMVDRGDIYLHSEQGGGNAMTSYERAILANPSSAQAYYKKGVLSVRSRNFNEAQASLKKATELDPSYAPAYRELADMYYYAGQNELALTTIKQYMGLAEPSPATNAQYASFLYLSKKYPDALTEVNKVLATDPSNLTMNRLKPYLLFETGDFAGAATAMDNFMKVAPANKIITDDYRYQGLILSRNGRYDEAIALFQKVIASDPTKACDLQNDLANAYTAKKDYKGAARAYVYHLTKCGGDLTDQFKLATAFGSDKQYMRADSVFNIILTARPTYGPGYLSRARNIYNLDTESKQGLAKPFYEQYITLSKAPESDPVKFRDGLVEANNYLGYYYLQQNKKTEALPYYEQVLALEPGNAGATKAVGIIKGKPAPAVKKPAAAPIKKK